MCACRTCNAGWTRRSRTVALQETKQEDHKFPEDALLELGYRSMFCGQKTYNGVAIVSRPPFAGECVTAIPGFEDPQKRVLAATVGDLRIVDLYVVNGEAVGSEKFDSAAALAGGGARMAARGNRRAPEPGRARRFQHRPRRPRRVRSWRWREKILCSTPEREYLSFLAGPGPARQLPPVQRRGRPPQLVGLPPVRLRARLGPAHRPGAGQRGAEGALHRRGIDREPRGWERPSDHTPCSSRSPTPDLRRNLPADVKQRPGEPGPSLPVI